MLLSCHGGWGARAVVAGMLTVVCGTLVSAQRPAPKGDQKPDAAAMAQQQAQNQEIQTVYHMADAAMAGTIPSDFPIQIQTDFLKAQANRVWVPLTLTLDPAKTTPGPLTLYLRVTPRGMTAPA